MTNDENQTAAVPEYRSVDPPKVISGAGILDKVDQKTHAGVCKVQSHSARRRQIDISGKESLSFDILEGTGNISVYGYKNAFEDTLEDLIKRIKAVL